MRESDLSKSALVIVGHGSSRNPDSCRPIYQHADTLRRRGLFREVLEAFTKQQPDLPSVLVSLTAQRIFVLPFFISDGFFTAEAIPAGLGLMNENGTAFRRCVRRGHQVLCYCQPVGAHPSMTEVLIKQAKRVVTDHPSRTPFRHAETALVIVGHGTERNENSRLAIEHQTQEIRARNLYGDVLAVYLEESPRVTAVYELTAAKSLVVLPYFISDGMHSREDIPVALGVSPDAVQERIQRRKPTWINPTIRQDRTIWLSPSIGSEPRLADVILEHVQEAATWSPE